jgi:hypothetical protein
VAARAAHVTAYQQQGRRHLAHKHGRLAGRGGGRGRRRGRSCRLRLALSDFALSAFTAAEWSANCFSMSAREASAISTGAQYFIATGKPWCLCKGGGRFGRFHTFIFPASSRWPPDRTRLTSSGSRRRQRQLLRRARTPPERRRAALLRCRATTPLLFWDWEARQALQGVNHASTFTRRLLRKGGGLEIL